MERARALDRKYPGDAEAAEVTGIAERLLGSRDAILARVERLLGQPGRDREAAKLAQVALRILPGDPRAAGLLAKAKNAGKDQTL
jgi:hypothetical protein